MFDYADENGRGEVCEPLARELARQTANVAALEAGTPAVPDMTDLETSALDWAAHVMQERTEHSGSSRAVPAQPSRPPFDHARGTGSSVEG